MFKPLRFLICMLIIRLVQAKLLGFFHKSSGKYMGWGRISYHGEVLEMSDDGKGYQVGDNVPLDRTTIYGVFQLIVVCMYILAGLLCLAW